MSIVSYNQNLERKVTGPGTSTCFTGALEQISPRHSLEPDNHEEYHAFALEYNEMPPLERYVRSPEFKVVLEGLANSLGRIPFDSILFTEPRSLAAFTRFINRVMAANYRVLVDIDVEVKTAKGVEKGEHAVGLVPTDNPRLFYLRSTWVPDSLKGTVTTADLFPLLCKPEDVYVPKRLWRDDLPFDGTCVTAFPPSRRGIVF